MRDEDADKAAVTTPADDGSGSEREGSAGAVGSRSPSTSATNPHKTEAERRFEEVQRKRVSLADGPLPSMG